MEALRPVGERFILACLALLIPLNVLGGAGEKSSPQGACGSVQAQLGAAQAGRAMVQQAMRAGMPWGDGALNEYVNRLGQNLARSSGSQQSFNFYVIYDPQVNAQAFPGGYVVVNTGVISLAESEAELASVLSHEIAHENSCDWNGPARKGNMVEMIAAVPAVLLGGPAGIAVITASGWASTLARARFNRAEEERADLLAAQYLAHAGYDPRAAIRFFERMQTEEEATGGEPGGLLATHPRTVDRQKKLEDFVPSLPAPSFVPHDEAEFLRMRKAVRDYDRIYSQVVGVRTPGQDAPTLILARRPGGE